MSISRTIDRISWPRLDGITGDLVILAAATGATYLAQLYDRPITAVLAYLIGVICVGARSGLYRGLLAAFAASFVYNFFLSEPVFRFGVSSLDEIVPLIAFNLSAIVTSALTGRLRDSVKAALAAEAENALLLKISDSLQKAIRTSDLEGVSRPTLIRFGVADLEIYVRGAGRYCRPSKGEQSTETLGSWMPSEGAPSTSGVVEVYELAGTSGDLGLVRFFLDVATTDEHQRPDLQPVANLLALALERCMLLEQLSETRAAQRTEALKSAIISSVSHDLRTPLTAIEAAAGSLRSFEQTLSSSQKDKMLATIADQCEKLNRYTSNLLDMGRIQAGISTDHFDDVDVPEILGVVLGRVRQTFPQQVIAKEMQVPSAIVRANGPMLEQAIFNIAENAIIHGTRDRSLRIGLAVEDAVVSLEIADSGPGIPQTDLPHIFERFYRSDKPSHRSGSGLGLYIAKGFVEAFGGTIEVVSPASSGKGTSITIRLPLVALTTPIGMAK